MLFFNDRAIGFACENGSGLTNPNGQKSKEEIEMSDVAQKVKDIIVEQLGVNADEVTEEASFIDDLGADSLDTVELVMALEEAFELTVPDEDAEKLTSVGAAIKYIEEHQK